MAAAGSVQENNLDSLCCCAATMCGLLGPSMLGSLCANCTLPFMHCSYAESSHVCASTGLPGILRCVIHAVSRKSVRHSEMMSSGGCQHPCQWQHHATVSIHQQLLQMPHYHLVAHKHCSTCLPPTSGVKGCPATPGDYLLKNQSFLLHTKVNLGSHRTGATHF